MQRLLTSLGLAILWIISCLPSGVISVLGIALGKAAYFIAGRRRRVGLINLELCFPKMSLPEKHKIIKEHFVYLMTALLEYSLVFFGSKKRLESLVKLKNMELVNKYYQKRPIILLCPHFVGLDLAASRLSQEIAGYSIYTTQKNASLSQALKNARERFMKDRGGQIFARNQGLRPVIRKLRETKLAFYYLPDQDLGARDSLYVPFFAYPTCATVNVLPKLVMMADAVVISVAVYRVDDHYEVEFSEAWDNYPTNDLHADVLRMNQEIERLVSVNIAQYFWLHKRFKTQPDGWNKLYE